MNYSEIKKTLSLMDNPIDKLEFVMDLGNHLAQIPDNADCNEIMGCVSFVKICQSNGKFYGVADSAMVRGIVAIFMAMVDGKSVDEIKNIDMESEFRDLNLNFGASRLNGINSMIRFFKNL